MPGALNADAVAAVDSTGQAAEFVDLAMHLRDALWRVDSAGIAPVEAPGGPIVAGMGGSAVGGRLARGAIGSRLRRPLAVADGYGLPGWAGPDTLVLCSSYSGTTEETLAAYDDAVERGAPRLVATTGGALGERARRDGVPVIPIPGGFQPRAAVGYSLVSALEAAAVCGAGPGCATKWRRRRRWPRSCAGVGPGRRRVQRGEGARPPAAWHGAGDRRDRARGLGRVPLEVPDQRERRAAAFAGALPEIDHNEVVGWPAARELGRFSAVFLQSPGAHPRDVLRTELTAEQARAGTDVVELVAPRGDTPLEHLISHVLLGDLVSLYLAVLRGKHPIDIAPIDALKAALAER